jgi:hypothetical protein
MNSTNTGNHILHRPLTPQDVEKLRINKVGMICRAAQKDFLKI